MISQICDDLNYIRKCHRSPENWVWWYHTVWRPLIIPTKLEIPTGFKPAKKLLEPWHTCNSDEDPQMNPIISLPQHMVFPHFCPIQFVGQCAIHLNHPKLSFHSVSQTTISWQQWNRDSFLSMVRPAPGGAKIQDLTLLPLWLFVWFYGLSR